jgi:hypothetical protein
MIWMGSRYGLDVLINEITFFLLGIETVQPITSYYTVL